MSQKGIRKPRKIYDSHYIDGLFAKRHQEEKGFKISKEELAEQVKKFNSNKGIK